MLGSAWNLEIKQWRKCVSVSDFSHQKFVHVYLCVCPTFSSSSGMLLSSRNVAELLGPQREKHIRSVDLNAVEEHVCLSKSSRCFNRSYRLTLRRVSMTLLSPSRTYCVQDFGGEF